MSKKNICAAVYVALALGICVFPAAAMPFAGTENSSENRVLAAAPSFKEEDGSFNMEWGADFESYFSDHFAFRQNMADAYSRIMTGTLKTSPQEKVILGKSGWMYYTPSIDDYVNQSRITEAGAKHMSRVLEMMDAYAALHGSEFIFTSAPNKNSVYPEYMPDRYICADENDTLTLLENKLADTEVSYCDLRSELSERAASDSRLLYHKTDTHWNNYGASIAYDALMNTAGVSHTDFSNMPFTEVQNWDGDLSKILYPASDEKDSNIEFDYEYTYTYAGRFRSADDMVIRTQSSNGEKSLLMFRDSFGRALIPFAAEDFAETALYRAEHFPIDALEKQPADVVILEIVERNLPNLLGYAPQMPAPAYTLPENVKEAEECSSAFLGVEKNGNYLHLYGTFDKSFEDHEGVYVTVSDEAGMTNTYEAFPCYEYSLLEKDAPEDNGYSLYIPVSSLGSSVNTVSVTVRSGSDFIDLGTAGQFQLGGS